MRVLAGVAVVFLAFACSDEPSAPVGPTPFEVADILASLTPVQLAKLVASDAAAGDEFGWGVAMSGDLALVGAPGDDVTGNLSGAAYIFRRRPGGGWIQEARLVAADAGTDDLFGSSVAVAGDVAVVGAIRHDHADIDAGSAYIFRRMPGGVWIQEEELVALDGATADYFGSAVAVSGDLAVVGAPEDGDAGGRSGSAYVFRHLGGGIWSPEAKFGPRDAAAGDVFGSAVAVSGDVAMVGAPGDDDAGLNSGSVYVFLHSGGIWIQEAKLGARDAVVGFGASVAVSGDVAAVGAPLGFLPGSAYIFRRMPGGVWIQESRLVASDGAVFDEFGDAVGLDGGVGVVGAPGDDDAGFSSGSAYVFLYEGGGWREEGKLVARDGAFLDVFGTGVAVSGDAAMVGARWDDDDGRDSGSAYVFELLDDPEAVIDDVIDEVEILAAGSSSTLAEELEDAISRLETVRYALAETPPDHETALKALEQAVDLLESAVSDGLLDPVEGAALMDRLAGVARDIAVAAIDDAIARGGDPDRIDEAEAELADGDSLRAAHRFTDAVDRYKDAFVSAERA